MKTSALQAYRSVQSAATSVLEDLGPTLDAGDTERTVAQRCANLLRQRGLPDTWYYDCPAFVLLGSRSCVSVSGKHYRPGDEVVGQCNLITVDLSPIRDGIWGDCARSFCVESGRWASSPATAQFVEGLSIERALHEWLRTFATLDRTAGELFAAANARINHAGYENLDFAGNVGHSIATRREDRIFIEHGASVRLGDLGLFTFEPHIRRRDVGRWGFKHENIYAFDDTGALVEI